MGGAICTLCCGAEREVSVACPLDCAYLLDAHRHEKFIDPDPEQIPNRDIELSERFLDEHEALINFTGVSVLDAALKTPGAVDSDAREALESLIRTYRTRQSGLYYETRPANLLAAAIQQRMQERFQEYQTRLRERAGLSAVRDADILGALVFCQRMALSNNNGRRLGRSFLGLLRELVSEAGLTAGPGGVRTRRSSSLVVP